MKGIISVLLLVICLIVNVLYGQAPARQTELLHPIIKNYTSDEYSLSPQNWCVGQDKRGIIYVANNEGLLEYDGVRWKKIVFSGGNTLTAMAIDDNNKVFVGGYDDLGFLKADSGGSYRFNSLLTLLKKEDQEFGVIWNIFHNQSNIYFQGETKLIRYNTRTQEIKTWNGKFHRSFQYKKSRLLVRDREKGLLELVGDVLKPLAGGERFVDVPVCFILPHESGQMLIGTVDKGMSLFDGKEYTSFQTDVDRHLFGADAYCGIQAHNGNYVIGTLQAGIVVITPQGKCVQWIDEQKGLQNNEIFHIYEDRNQNIWFALGSGISRLDLFGTLSNVTRFNNQKRIFYKVLRFKSTLVALTNYGIYQSSKRISEAGSSEFEFERVDAIPDNQCWDILMLPNELLISTTGYGIYSYDLGRARIIVDNRYQAYTFCRSVIDTNRVYIGLKDGIASLYKQNGQWVDEGKINGITAEIRSVAETPEGNLWLATFFDGAIYLDISNGRNHPKATAYGADAGLDNIKDLGIYRQADGRFIFYHSKGLSRFNPKKNIFEPEAEYGQEFVGGNAGTFMLKESTKGTTWLLYFEEDDHTKDAVWMMRPNKAGGFHVTKNLFSRIPPTKLHYVFPEADGVTWVAHENGLARLDLNLAKNFNVAFPTLVRRIIANGKETVFGGAFFSKKDEGLLQQPASMKIDLPFDKNSLRFEVASLSYDRSEGNEYQYLLEGLDPDWTPWTKESQKDYTNLSEGSYKFRVRSRNIYGTIGTEGVYEFSVLPPWYRTWWAWLVYILAAGGSIYGVFRWRLRRLEEDKRILEQKVTERTAEVVQQAKELEEKNHEITQINEEIIQQRDEILAFNEQITKQKEEIEHQNNEILDSINYARRIQDSILPDISDIRRSLPKSFVLYRPKDVVSGDFFWFSSQENICLIAAVDCTGHGIPGAFMSVMGSSLLNQIVNEKGLTDPGPILNTLNDLVRYNLHQTDHTSTSKDGMDPTLAVIDYANRLVHFAGANNPLYYVHNGELTEFKTNKYPIGGGQYEGRNFETQVLQCEEGDVIYLFSDGYADQFGGPKRRKFMYGQYKRLLTEICTLPPDEQLSILDKTMTEWMDACNMHQIDDILVIGIQF